MIRFVFILFAIFVGGAAGYFGYFFPQATVGLSGISATVLSVLVAVSMSIFAILSVGANFAESDSRRAKRMQRLLSREDGAIVDQQLIIFYFLLVSLFLNLSLQFIEGLLPSEKGSYWNLLSGVTSGLTGLSLVLAFLMPNILVGVIRRNRGL